MECRRSTSEAENIKKERERQIDARARSPSRLYEIVARLAAPPSTYWVACGVRMDGHGLASAGQGILKLKGADRRTLRLVSRQPPNLIVMYLSGPPPPSLSASARSPDRLRQLVKLENTLLHPSLIPSLFRLPSLDSPANELQLTPPPLQSSVRLPAPSPSPPLHFCLHQSTFMRPLFHCAKNDRKQRCSRSRRRRAAPLTAPVGSNFTHSSFPSLTRAHVCQ